MAAPHVAGAWALLKQQAPKATVAEVLTALQTTGLSIRDPRNGVTTSQIRMFQALSALSGRLRVMEFPAAPSGVVGLTFLLWVTNGTTASIPISITTVPNGQTSITRPFTLGPSQIASFGPGDVTCPAGQVCRLVVIHTAGPAAVFDAILQISDAEGSPAGFITPTFVYTTQ